MKSKGKELGWGGGWESLHCPRQTALQAAGRMELLSKPLHYANCLTTQTTVQCAQTNSVTHKNTHPHHARTFLPTAPRNSPAFIRAAGVKRHSTHHNSSIAREKKTKRGNTTDFRGRKCFSWLVGRWALTGHSAMGVGFFHPELSLIEDFRILGTSCPGQRGSQVSALLVSTQ